MTFQYYAMDFAFFSSTGTYGFADRCEITRAAGYDAIQTVIWDGTQWERCQELATVKDRFGLTVSGVYTVLDLSLGEQNPRNSGLLRMIETMPEGSTVELAIKSAGSGIVNSDPRGDTRVIAWLSEALSIAERRRIQVSLYIHLQFWVEKHDDAIRLCEQINHPNLGLTFSSLQWYAADGQDIGGLLSRAVPWIRRANFSGSRRSPLGFFQVATIEPLDTGELDNFAIFARLTRLGYRGPLGYNGWHEGGDPFVKLERSLRVLKDMQRRVDANPHWGAHLDA